LVRRRLNAREAAGALGISVDAVRMRARRGTLESEHDANGRLHVWVDTDEAPSDTSALISEMRGRIEDLRTQLESERQAHSEARRLLAAALERIPPQLEAPERPSEAPESPGPSPPSTDAGDGQEAATERPWWRRMFGG
jgi:hypothetical protein